MNDKIVFPKIKFDTGGTPIEYTVEQVPFGELLHSPEDVHNENDINQDYKKGSVNVSDVKIKINTKRKRF